MTRDPFILFQYLKSKTENWTYKNYNLFIEIKLPDNILICHEKWRTRLQQQQQQRPRRREQQKVTSEIKDLDEIKNFPIQKKSNWSGLKM